MTTHDEIISQCIATVLDGMMAYAERSDEHSPYARTRVYAMRIPYGHEQFLAQKINDEAIGKLESGVPLHDIPLAFAPVRENVLPPTGGRPERVVRESLIPNLLFLFATEAMAVELRDTPFGKEHVSRHANPAIVMRFMYDHTVTFGDGSNPRLTIPPRQIKHFIRIAESANPHIRILPSDFHFKEKALYRVTAGPFAGLEGYGARVRQQSVLLVDIRPIGYVMSCYISKRCLELVEREEDEKK